MISTPEPMRQPRCRLRLLAALVLAAALPSAAGAGEEARGFVRQAHAALARSDGIAAEMALRKALAAGLPREAVAARMGEALLDQGKLDKARGWLVPARFTAAEAPHGWRVLGRVEQAAGNLVAAGRAYDQALRLAPNDSRLWVDIARLRYAGGQQIQAIAAADHALSLDPDNVRALEFRGLVVRDSLGLVPALPWFEAGLKLRPDDLSVLGEYAATLGELGRARAMLVVTRRMIELDPRSPRAWFLQAVLAARAGNHPLARGLLARTGTALADMPAALLLQGVLELEAGNTNLAVELLDRLARRQPHNRTARLLLARAIDAAGNRRQLAETFAADAARADASPWLLTLVARAHEDLGERDKAAPLLERAAAAGAPPVVAIAEAAPLGVLAPRYAEDPGGAASAEPYLRALLAAGRPAEAGAIAERLFALAPGSGATAALAGDLRMAGGDPAGAVEAWRRAAAVRLDDNLMLRLVAVYRQVGRADDARRLVDGVLAARPRNRTALRLAAGFAAERDDWPRAAGLLGWLAENGAGSDARLMADLALARLRSGDGKGALLAGEQAFRLQPAARPGAEAWGMALAFAGGNDALAGALLARPTEAAGPAGPVLQEARTLLARRRGQGAPAR